MPVPQYSDKYGQPSILSGKEMVEYQRSIGRFPKEDAPESVLLCLEQGLPRRMRWRCPATKIGRFVGDMLLWKRGRGRVGIMANFGIGAPVVVGIAEVLAAWGVRNLALLSMAGGIQSDLAEGTVVVIEAAVRDEGVSQHYLPDSKISSANHELTSSLRQALARRGIEHKNGRSWSTSAPFRETTAELAHYRTEGILIAEMEAAALFAFGQASNVRTVAASVVGDNLSRIPWKPPSQISAVQSVLGDLYVTILHTLLET
jgi:purine-nucleoside phosphorylase